ncbi:pentatricopeptide repeat-containing protein, partial [bacterium]|nr:pentatricopeptide repeat-containing protein [bacterium]
RKHCKARDMRAALSCLGAMRRAGVRPNDRTYNTLIQGWIELKRMDRAMDLFREMKRRKVRPDIVTYNLLITGWAREMKRMDKAEEMMSDLMNNPMVSPNTRTFNTLIRGYLYMCGDRRHREERMYFWLCQMRDFKIQPDPHTAKHFNKMNLYFPSVDGPFWTRDFGMPFDPQRHGHSRLR